MICEIKLEGLLNEVELKVLDNCANSLNRKFEHSNYVGKSPVGCNTCGFCDYSFSWGFNTYCTNTPKVMTQYKIKNDRL